MAPIYDTDNAESRWSEADWENYELWERVASRQKRQKRLWIQSAVLMFLVLAAVPVVMDRNAKWATLAATRRLAEEVNRIRRDAGADHAAYRLRFSRAGRPEYSVEKAASCSEAQSTPVRNGNLFPGNTGGDYILMSRQMGENFGIPGLTQDLCYDYLSGSDAVLKGEQVVGFGVVPVQDLSDKRLDRISILLLSGPSAEPSFD